MNKLIAKKLHGLWEDYHTAEQVLLRDHDDTSLRLTNRRLAEITTRFSTKELLKTITDWDFPLWLRNDERIICEQMCLKRPARDNLPIIGWDGINQPSLTDEP